MVKPVTQQDVTEASVYLAEDQVCLIVTPSWLPVCLRIIQVYYDYFNHYAHRGAAKGKHVTISAALHEVPLLIRGGSILSTRERHRRSSPLMKLDPFTLRVALDNKGAARGELYLDDGVTYDHEKGQIVWREFIAEKPEKKAKTLRISSRDLAKLKPAEAVDGVALTSISPTNEFAKSIESVRVEKIVVLGLSSKPKSVAVDGSQALEFIYTAGVPAVGKKEGTASVLVVKDPGVAITKDWEVSIEI